MGERLNAAMDVALAKLAEGGEAAQDAATHGLALSLEQIAALRAAMFQDGAIDEDEARRILNAHRKGVGKAHPAAWEAFFVLALSEFFALQREQLDFDTSMSPLRILNAVTGGLPERAVKAVAGDEGASVFDVDADAPNPKISELEAKALIHAFRAEGGFVLDRAERRLVARLFGRAIETPDVLRTFALAAMVATVSQDGKVDADEVELLTAVLFGPAGEGGGRITREEAEAVLAIRQAATQGANAPGWADFVARVLVAAVLADDLSPDEIDRAETFWLLEHVDEDLQADPAWLAFLDRVRSLGVKTFARFKPLLEAAAAA